MKSKLILLILIVFIFLMMNIPIFAGMFPDKPYDAFDYWLIYQHENGSYYLLSCTSPVRAFSSGETLETPMFSEYRKYKLEYNIWVLSSYDESGDANNHRGFVEILASNHDICYRNSSEVFFSQRKATVLYPVMKGVDFGTILRTFSAGLIPLVGLIVLVISFRKGWDFLQSQLMH